MVGQKHRGDTGIDSDSDMQRFGMGKEGTERQKQKMIILITWASHTGTTLLEQSKHSLLSHNFLEQRKLRTHNGFRHLGHEIIVENFV